MVTSKSNSPRSMATSLVRNAGVRMTRQRRAVLETILASHDHPTAAIIFERTKAHMPGISLATVYNCLETLSESGIINHLNFDNGPSRFCPNLEPHVHLLDDTNNRVLDIQLKPGLRPEDVFELPEGTCVTRMDACLHGNIPV
jgi:Fur family peroxide stress response transcriptional regulator